jgi:hypothetical protein
MIKKTDPDQIYLDDFKTQFGGKLRKDNRWVRQAGMLPWEVIEDIYATNFSRDRGPYCISGRIAFGAMYIQEQLGFADREVAQQIAENPYMQYFLGLSEYRDEPLFDASMLVHFRKRFPEDFVNRINQMMFEPEVLERITKGKGGDGDGGKPSGPPSGGGSKSAAKPKNKGKVVLDATVAPADVRYPNDLSLLNESRENLERIIEELWQYGDREGHKTGYRRKKARKEYLAIAKQKKPRGSKIRNAIGNQLRYIWKDIEAIGKLLLRSGLKALPEKRIARIMTICEVYRQQKGMYDDRNHKVEKRIVSLRQPHVRPMVRGKSGKPYEFGQKISASVVEGYTFLDRQDYESFNEGNRLIGSVEAYRARYGFYPEAVLADKIYRNRGNLSYCKEHGIRLSGPRLGRPKTVPTIDEKRQTAKDNSERNIVEGRFGTAKRRFRLGLVMAYLPETGLTKAAMKVLCMNISIKLKRMALFILSFSDRLFCVIFDKNIAYQNVF